MGELVQRIRQFVPLGVELPAMDEQEIASLKIREEDLILLSQDLDGRGPWLEATVSLLHLLRASAKLMRPMGELVQRIRQFVPLGVKLPDLDEQEIASLKIREEDLILLSRNLDGRVPWLEGTVSPVHLLRASAKLKRPMGELVQRIRQFVPLGFELPDLEWQMPDQLQVTDDDVLMLSKHLDGELPMLQGDVPPLHLARAADLRNEPLTTTFARMKEFSSILGLNLPASDPEDWDLDTLFQL
jgi:hypothetical protein